MKRVVILYVLILGVTTLSLGQDPVFQSASSASGINNPGKNYGVSVVDYDNDGDDDIYITRQNGEPNILYQNDGNGVFMDVAPELGLAHTGNGLLSCWADTDNDGDQDLYIGNRNENDVFYRNDNGTFVEMTFLAGIQNFGEPRSVNFADVDNDGDLDLNVANLSAENQFYINTGNNVFLNSTTANGPMDSSLSMGALFFDYDNDNDQDLYLTHDANIPNILYQNDGNAIYTDVSEESNTNIAANGMGVEKADFNLDGYFDVYITNLYENSLLLNNGDGTFSDISTDAGIEDLGMGWGVFCMDYDNDGYKDIYINNESNFPPFESNKLYRNNGDNTFTIVSSGNIISSTSPGFGAACADFDNNGKEDIFIANRGEGGNQLFLNFTPTNNSWLKISLVGVESNRDGIGARINVDANGNTYISEVASSSGYCSQNSRIQHFGLDNAAMVDEIRVLWPSGIIDTIYNVSTNQHITITENQSTTSIGNIIPLEGFDIQFQNPSPKNVQFTYDNTTGEKVALDIFNANGGLISKHIIDTGNGELRAYMSSPGTYFIRSSIGEKQSIRSIIVQ